MNLRELILAVVSLLTVFLFDAIVGFDPSFPLDQASFTDLILWGFGYLLNLIGLPATGAALYASRKVYLLKKNKETEVGQYIVRRAA